MMKSGLGLFWFLVVAMYPALATQFFVSPHGNDSFSGTRPARNWRHSDGPFASVERALQAAETAAKPVTILVREGTYYLSRPLVITPVLSGITISAYRAEMPVISGGRVIGGWRKTRQNGRDLWVAEVPELKSRKWSFHQLWSDGEPLSHARHPNSGYLSIAELPDKTADWTQGQMRFRFAPGEVPSWSWTNGAEAVIMTRWVESRLPIMTFDPVERLVACSKRSVFQLSPGDPFYLEGALEAVDQPGEWGVDAPSGRIFYYPRKGERPGQFRPVAPVLPRLLEMEGTIAQGRYVENVSFKGITFAHSEWYFANGTKDRPEVWPAVSTEVGGFAQAAIGVPGAVTGRGTRGVTFENCRFTCLGSYGLEFSSGSSSNVVNNCEFSHLGAGGIRLGTTSLPKTPDELSRANVVTNCTIFDGGRLFHSAIGVWIGQSPDNILANNLIHDFYYTAISIGWTWGYGPAAATNNIVRNNHIHHIGAKSGGDGPILSDMGGIYTLGMQPGTRISNNLWHDIAGLRYGGWGIYFDEGSSSIIAESNQVYRTTHGGFHQHYGATNLVRNNIFAFAQVHQVQRTRPEGHVSFTFTNNVVYFDTGVLLGGNWSDNSFIMESNVYFDARPGAVPAEMKFAGATIGDWRARGHDVQSMVVDPLVEDLSAHTFRFLPYSPALTNGFFKQFDLSDIGPKDPRK